MITLTVLLNLLLQFALLHLSSAAVGSGSNGPPELQSQPQPQTANKGESDHHLKLLLSYENEILRFQFYPISDNYGDSGKRRTSFILKKKRSSNGHDQNQDQYQGSGNREIGKWKPTLLPVRRRPTFIPYIGPRSLTNIRKFFGHLRENLDAILESKKGRGSNYPKAINSHPAWRFTNWGLGKRGNYY